MANQMIEVEAETLEDARAEIKSKTPAGQMVLSERVISDGKPHTVHKSAKTMEEALRLARKEVPAEAKVIEEKKLEDAQAMTQTVEAFTEEEILTEIKILLGSKAKIKDKKQLVAPRKGFLGIGKKPGSYEVTAEFAARASVTWKSPARITAEVRKKPEPRSRFEPFFGLGVCDVCNSPLIPGASFKVPVEIFYSSPRYRNYLKRSPFMSMMGVGGNVEMHILNMALMDHSTHSAVCSSCIHMFE